MSLTKNEIDARLLAEMEAKIASGELDVETPLPAEEQRKIAELPESERRLAELLTRDAIQDQEADVDLGLPMPQTE